MTPSQKPQDGGPAFPQIDNTGRRGMGMSLRDYFASQALIGVMNICRDDTRSQGETNPQMFSRKAYELADAMLAARESKP